MSLKAVTHIFSKLKPFPSFCAVAVFTIIFCALTGISFLVDIDEDRAAISEVKLKAVIPMVETIAIDMDGVRVLGAVITRGSKYPESFRSWTGLETKEWLILNRSSAFNTCYTVMDPFLRRTKAKHSPLPAASMDLVVSAISGRTVTAALYVPRFTGRPAGLGYCPGYRYDEATGMLMVGARKVAVFAKEARDLQ